MNDNKYFIIFRKLIESIDNKNDAIELYNIYKDKVSAEYQYIMKSIIDGKIYNKSLDTFTFYKIIVFLNNIKYKDECDKYINILYQNTDDIIQKRIIERIIDSKDYSNINSKNISINISKKCPHCDKVYTKTSESDYVICGFTNKGYNSSGCGRDWCFKCNKKLCKSWYKNQLFDLNNRLHNGICCKQYSVSKNENYNDYCNCIYKLFS